MPTINETLASRDDYAVYGEKVASPMRGAKQDSRAISIAKNHIDKIFQLAIAHFRTPQVMRSFRTQDNPVSNDQQDSMLHFSSQPSAFTSSMPSVIIYFLGIFFKNLNQGFAYLGHNGSNKLFRDFEQI